MCTFAIDACRPGHADRRGADAETLREQGQSIEEPTYPPDFALETSGQPLLNRSPSRLLTTATAASACGYFMRVGPSTPMLPTGWPSTR
jgi:hypothetical protein